MNSKNIARHLKSKINDWIETVESEDIKKTIKGNVIVTGGALVSLLNGEEPHDYDIYFKTEESCQEVAAYYARVWNKTQKDKNKIQIQNNDGRITCFISETAGVVEDAEINELQEPFAEDVSDKKKPKYRPKFFTTNAISLSDKIQLVIRFYGNVEEIHTNYDFVHCTCSYDYKENSVNLPAKALECIVNKELVYLGSKYPLCSIIRTRKFIARGYIINAGQYLKMAWQLNELDLTDHEVLKDQLAGVDSLYFKQVIDALKDMNGKVDDTKFFDVINKIFG